MIQQVIQRFNANMEAEVRRTRGQTIRDAPKPTTGIVLSGYQSRRYGSLSLRSLLDYHP